MPLIYTGLKDKMQSSNKKVPETATLNTFSSQISPEIWLSLATAPVLVGIWGVQQLSGWLQTAGIFSEEVFRGDRLPVLHFPPTPLSERDAEGGE